MTDDERIARLSELARRALGSQTEAHVVWRDEIATVRGVYDVLEMLIPKHPRGLDALEAALSVLAGEDRYESTTRYAKAMLERAEAAEAQRAEWMRLADEHMEAKNEATARIAELEAQVARAWELRERWEARAETVPVGFASKQVGQCADDLQAAIAGKEAK